MTTTPGGLDAAPGVRIRAACAQRGTRAVAEGCANLLEGAPVDDDLVVTLGGRSALPVLDGQQRDYWLRVWGARGLLYAWDDVALPSVIGAASDESWRVREMVAKVVARHRLDDAATAIAGLRSDPTPRVRAAAQRALERLAAPAQRVGGRKRNSQA